MVSRFLPRCQIAEAASDALPQAASYGDLQPAEINNFQMRVMMLQGRNPQVLAKPARWQTYLWTHGRHWAVVLRPVPDLEGDETILDVCPELLRKPSLSEELYEKVPAKQAFVVIELLVATSEQVFFPRFTVFPGFNINHSTVTRCECTAPCLLSDIAGRALDVIGGFKSYGVLGCNCQHFANGLLQSLGLQCRLPEDISVMHAAEKGVQAVSLFNGLCKGIVCAKAATAVGSSLTTAGTAGAGTLAVGIGAAAVTGHLLLGCAVGAAVSSGIQRSYSWVSKKHRRDAEAEAEEHIQMIGYSENWTAEAAELLAIEGAQCKITTRQGRQLQLGPDGALIELADIDPFHDFPLTVGKEVKLQPGEAQVDAPGQPEPEPSESQLA